MLSSVLTLIAYFLGWAVLHSLMASLPVKRHAHGLLGERLAPAYRLLFNAVAGLTLMPVLALLAFLPDRVLYAVQSPWSWLMRAGQLVFLLGLLWTLAVSQPLHFAGIAQVLNPIATGGPLQVRGLYCHVRHPMYACSLVLIWLTPAMTANLLAVYGMMTLYFWFGSIHEERRLLDEYGPAYADYRRQVPRLLPRLKRCELREIAR